MISPPSKVSPGEKVTAAHHNALLDYVLRTTPRAGRNTTITEKPNGCFINAQPGGTSGSAALPLFPFSVRMIPDPDEEQDGDVKYCIAIYLPTYAVYIGNDPAAPSDTISSIAYSGPDWYKIIRAEDDMPVEPPQTGETVVVYIALGRAKDEEAHLSYDATRLLVEKTGGGGEQGSDEDSGSGDFFPSAKVPVASIYARSTSSQDGGASVVYEVTQYLYSALAWPKPEVRPWTWDPAMKGWRNAWYQNNRSVHDLPSSVTNEDLGDGVYYLKITLATNTVDLVCRGENDDPGDFISTEDLSFFLVGAVVDGNADESNCPHHIPIEIHYE